MTPRRHSPPHTMDVVVTFEYRFTRTPDGAVWSQMAYGYNFFRNHYLRVFDGVKVVARVQDVPTVLGSDFIRVDGPGVVVHALPYYVGPAAYLRQFRRLARAVRGAVGPTDAVILRVPSAIAKHMEPLLRRQRRPYGVQVVGDPVDIFGAIRHPLRPLLRWWFPRVQRRQCAGAAAASYVTEKALQRRYPCGGYTTHFSSVELTPDAVAAAPRVPAPGQKRFTLLNVGSLDQLYKAPDVLIDAAASLVDEGLDLHLVFVGDGRFRPELEERARARGVGGRVVFRGKLPAGPAVRAELDRADLYVHPSRTEGLPRAIIEAMARGLPVIGSTVGGIPELLDAQDMVPPDDVTALAGMIRAVLDDPARMAAMAARNLARAADYGDEILRERRDAYFRYLRDATEKWSRDPLLPPPAPSHVEPEAPQKVTA